MTHEPLSDRLEEIGKEMVDSAYRAHKELGPGLLEPVYEECMVLDLCKKSFEVEQQVALAIEFDGQVLASKLRIDMLVEGAVIVENKAVVELYPLFESQLLTCLKVGRKRLGYLINDNVSLIKTA